MLTGFKNTVYVNGRNLQANFNQLQKTTAMLLRVSSLIALLALAFFLPACHTAQKYMESGNYDDAIDYCVQRLRGKSNKKTELVQGLEAAFAKAQERDIQLAERLLTQGHQENWIRINSLYRQINDRQRTIRPLLPLVSKDGYRARFNLLDVSNLEHDSRKNAADFLYTQAEAGLQRAAAGDRMAAREAYAKLRELEQNYFNVYREKESLKEEARRLGTSWVLVELNNQSGYPLPYRFEEEVMALAKSDLDEEWVAFMFDPKPGFKPDYTAQLRIENIAVSPEQVSERRYTDTKTIKDGWEYALDERGNVKKDTAGNDIKVDKFVTIRADVIEVFQRKAARLEATVMLFDAANNRLDNDRLSEEIVFEHFASTFIGDARALSDNTRCRIGNRPAPFPSHEAMLLDAACRMRDDLRRNLKNSNAIR